ncbi:hypothetical protein AVEN_230682-1 [Araneus ventricosus]|uniref:Uncharacterized protein n=1 Tax=Araneus ventricosus TaxID=182803 RepID=A0A4Y2A1Q1_ARAVE|nr:hypothetical protein AVEN_230682-1 [Araneus ventricosus]
MKRNVRRAQRKYDAAKYSRGRRFLRTQLKKVESEYTWSLNKAKREDWSEVCEKVTPKEPFETHFEVAKNPDRRHFQLCSTLKEGGNISQTP